MVEQKPSKLPNIPRIQAFRCKMREMPAQQDQWLSGGAVKDLQR
jgi:hypothetical protein